MKYIYVCGPTVYDKVHLGNLRPILSYDIFIRALNALDEPTFLIHNITDIDDKIIAKAQEMKVSEKTISEKYTNYYLEILALINIKKPNKMPKVTNNISNIIEFIKCLLAKGYAYLNKENVYFSTKKIAQYGQLSNISFKDMITKEDVLKKDPFDFVLWKKTQKGIQFDSPWGQGRPGWHTECALFVDKYLKGKTLDIHGGGVDLKFPHHENENAQYLAMHNVPIAKHWIHTGLLNLNGIKMSKSLGNIIEPMNFLNEYGVDSLRLMFLSFQPSTPIMLNHNYLKELKKDLVKFKKAFYQSQLNLINFDLETIKDFLQLIIEWKFAMLRKEINLLIKNFNSDKTNVLNSIKIYTLFKTIGFVFAKQDLKQSIIDQYWQWIDACKNKSYNEADKIREILIKEKII